MRVRTLGVLLVASACGLVAAEEPARPKLALVLSGGGARGAAHIGVLKVLEEKKIVPDLIVGTSMGSIVGGLYAAGYSPQEIEDILAGIDWNQVFFDTPERRDRTFRRKQDDDVFLIPTKLRFKGLKVYMPSGVLGGQRLDLTLRTIVDKATAVQDFDELTVPYRAVAMDLSNGEAVVIGDGSLAEAMRASMSVPGAFPPVVRDGRTLVDGGAAANLPIGIAQSLGATRILAVDISSPLNPEVEGRSFMGVLDQLSALLTVGNREEDVKRLRPGDLLITPDLTGIKFDEFDKAREAVGIGEKAARENLSALTAFGADDATWEAFQRRHHRSDLHEQALRGVTIDNKSWVDDRVIQERLDIPVGQPVDRAALDRQLVLLSGLDYFGILRPDLTPVEGGVDLHLTVPGKPYSRGSLQFGLSLDTDLSGEATFTLIARHRVMAVNTRGGEWKNTAQVGSTRLLSTEFYQPLDWGMRWFFAPVLTTSRSTQRLWVDGVAIGDFRVDTQWAGVDFGRVLAEKVEIRVGVFRGQEDFDQTVGIPLPLGVLDNLDFGGFRVTLRADTAEAAAFPSKGATMGISLERDLAAFGAEEDSTILKTDLAQAFEFRGSTFTLRFAGSTVIDGSATLRTAAVLGGLGRLSGLGTNELFGERGGFAGFSWYQRLTEIPLGSFKNRVFVGVSLEAGNTYLEGEPITWPSLRAGGAVFLGAATPLGPAYLGWGWTEPDRNRWYLLIGERF
jgi:NTE family protein